MEKRDQRREMGRVWQFHLMWDEGGREVTASMTQRFAAIHRKRGVRRRSRFCGKNQLGSLGLAKSIVHRAHAASPLVPALQHPCAIS